MSHDINGQLVTFYCDNCDESFEAAGSFKDVWATAKDEGGVSRMTTKNGNIVVLTAEVRDERRIQGSTVSR